MRYKALTSIKYEFKEYKPGDVIELPEANAERLLLNGAIEPFVKPFARKFEKTTLHLKSQG